MSKAKKNVFAVGISLSEDGILTPNVELMPGFETHIAEIIFKMSDGSLGQMFLGILNEKYPELAPAVNAEIEIMGQQYLEQTGYKTWLKSDMVSPEMVFGGQQGQQNGG